jgi:hypothetical protein
MMTAQPGDNNPSSLGRVLRMRRGKTLLSEDALFLLSSVLLAAVASANPSDPRSSFASQNNGQDSADTQRDAEDLFIHSIHLPHSSSDSLSSKEERLHGATFGDSPSSKLRRSGLVKDQYLKY